MAGMIRARRSADGHFLVCGNCGEKLARRDAETIDGTVHYDLSWDSDWHRVPGSGDIGPRRDDPLSTKTQPGVMADYARRDTFAPAHIERTHAALDRLDHGNAPTRRGTGRQLFADHPPALCPWGDCRTLNRIDPKKLQLG